MAIRVPAIAGKVIHIGRAGEKNATIVTFDVSEWIKDFGGVGTFTLYVQQGGGFYVQSLIKDQASQLNNNTVEWLVSDFNTGTIGLGKCELQYNISGVIVKSIIYDIVVTNSLDMEAQGDPPDPIASWLNEIGEMLDDIYDASRWAVGPTEAGTPGIEPTDNNNAKYWAEQAQNNGRIYVGSTTTGNPGTNAQVSVDNTDNGWQLNFTIPEGQQGIQGERGIRGSLWYAGSKISGASQEPTIFPNSNIEFAEIEDQYLNTSSGNTYQCTFSGNSATAKWIYTGNIKGPTGPQGSGLKIIDHVNNVSDLPSATNVSIGTAYGVGSTAPYDIYISNGSIWQNFGKIQTIEITLKNWTK